MKNRNKKIESWRETKMFWGRRMHKTIFVLDLNNDA
jgi:hypothetical protein